MTRISARLLPLGMAISAHAHAAGQAPDNVELLKNSSLWFVAGLGGACILVFMIKLALADDAKAIQKRNSRARALYQRANALLKSGDHAQAQAIFIEARSAFNLPGFHLEQALAVMGAADAAEAMNQFDQAKILYGEARQILLDHPIPHLEPLPMGHDTRWEVERSRTYQASLDRCRAKLLI